MTGAPRLDERLGLVRANATVLAAALMAAAHPTFAASARGQIRAFEGLDARLGSADAMRDE